LRGRHSTAFWEQPPTRWMPRLRMLIHGNPVKSNSRRPSYRALPRVAVLLPDQPICVQRRRCDPRMDDNLHTALAEVDLHIAHDAMAALYGRFHALCCIVGSHTLRGKFPASAFWTAALSFSDPVVPPLCLARSALRRFLAAREQWSAPQAFQRAIVEGVLRGQAQFAQWDRRIGPCERITERSMMFSSSLTFSGHVQFTNAFMVSAGTVSICFFIRRAKSCTK
jgi:hypothetical protein